MMTGWLYRYGIRILFYGFACFMVLRLLYGIRQSGKTDAKMEQLQKTLVILHAQAEAAAHAPRSRNELVDELRQGRF